MMRFLTKLSMGNRWKWYLGSAFLLASNAALGMPHPWYQQQNALERSRRVILQDHKCVSVPARSSFTFEQCLYIRPTAPSAAEDHCVGGCYKGVYLESFKMCVFQRGSTCSAEEKEVKVKITAEASCVEEERRNTCRCGEWRRLPRPREGTLKAPRCD